MNRNAILCRELQRHREHAAESIAFARRNVPQRVRDELDYIASIDQRPSWTRNTDLLPLHFWAFWLGVGLPLSLAVSYAVFELAMWFLPIMWGLS